MNKAIFILGIAIMTSSLISSCVDSSLEPSTFNEITIGNQVWMTQNLNLDKFRNGDTIPYAKTDEEWDRAGSNSQPAWCYFDNDNEKGKKFGKLYNWYAVNDPRGLAPEGWHVPTNEDWNSLTNFLGGESVAGKKMKSTFGWLGNGNGSNESGFLGLPGGHRANYGVFSDINYGGYWWSSNQENPAFAWSFSLHYGSDTLSKLDYFTQYGFSVRCIKD